MATSYNSGQKAPFHFAKIAFGNFFYPQTVKRKKKSFIGNNEVR